VLCFEGFGGLRLRFQVQVDLGLVAVVIAKSRMNLRKGQVAKLPHDFLRNQTTGRSGEPRHPSPQCRAGRRESRDVERSGCLFR